MVRRGESLYLQSNLHIDKGEAKMNEQSCARLEACRHRMISCLSLVFISCGMMLCVCQPASADILASGDVTPDVNTWDATTAGYVGYSSDATLTVDNGSDLLADTFMIARNSGVTGVATVTGTDSTVTCSGRLTAGHQGSGTLNITDGGAFSCKETRVGGSSVAGSTGVVNVNGVNSTWTSGYIQIGYEASNGTVNVTNNGTVTTASYVRVGSSAGSSGLLRVDGNGSSLTSTSTSGLYVGHNGDGTIQITNGGTVRNYGARIGSEVGATGAVTVDGAGSNWTMTGSSLYVGYNGTGTLTITNGGLVSVATTLTIDNSGAEQFYQYGHERRAGVVWRRR